MTFTTSHLSLYAIGTESAGSSSDDDNDTALIAGAVVAVIAIIGVALFLFMKNRKQTA